MSVKYIGPQLKTGGPLESCLCASLSVTDYLKNYSEEDHQISPY